MLVVPGGCNVIGVVASKTMPAPRKPAAHELAVVPTDVRVVADARIYGERAFLDAEPVAQTLERDLERETEVPIIDNPAEAGQTVVVRLEPMQAESIMGSDLRTGTATARVRVLDARGEEIWPADGSPGRLVTARSPRVETSRPEAFRREVLRGLGKQIAALFYPQVIEN